MIFILRVLQDSKVSYRAGGNGKAWLLFKGVAPEWTEVIKIVICDLDHENAEAERAVLEAAGYEFDWLHCKTQEGWMFRKVGHS